MAARDTAGGTPSIVVRVECKLHMRGGVHSVPFDSLRHLFRRTELVFTTVHVNEEYLSSTQEAVLTLGVRQEPTKRQTAPTFVTLAAGVPHCKAVTAASGLARLGSNHVSTDRLWHAAQVAPRDGLISRSTVGAFFWRADINVNESKTGCISFRVPPMGQSVTLELMPRLCDGMNTCGLPRPVFAIDLYWGQLCVYTTRANVYHSAWKRGTIIANGSPDALELYYDSASRMWSQQIVPTPSEEATHSPQSRQQSTAGASASMLAVRTVRKKRLWGKDKWPAPKSAKPLRMPPGTSKFSITPRRSPTQQVKSSELPSVPGVRMIVSQQRCIPVLGFSLPDTSDTHASHASYSMQSSPGSFGREFLERHSWSLGQPPQARSRLSSPAYASPNPPTPFASFPLSYSPMLLADSDPVGGSSQACVGEHVTGSLRLQGGQ